MTCCVAPSSAVFDGCRQVVCACLRRHRAQSTSGRITGRKGSMLYFASRFLGDKRSRLREIFANIVNRIPLFPNFGSLQFSAGPSQWSYDATGTRPAGASARIALPDPACVVSVDDWSPKSIAQSLNAPARSACFTKFFNDSMHQWRSVVRRMVRCKLAGALPSDTAPERLAAGALAVPKDEDRDRFICDHRL